MVQGLKRKPYEERLEILGMYTLQQDDFVEISLKLRGAGRREKGTRRGFPGGKLPYHSGRATDIKTKSSENTSASNVSCLCKCM